jgi:hypothetical protein
MPNADIPAILAVADSLALSSATLNDSQRQAALEAIATFRALAPHFLDTAEKIITEGTGDSAELFSTTMQGHSVSTALHIILKPLWSLGEAVHTQRNASIAVMGKEVSGNG